MVLMLMLFEKKALVQEREKSVEDSKGRQIL